MTLKIRNPGIKEPSEKRPLLGNGSLKLVLTVTVKGMLTVVFLFSPPRIYVLRTDGLRTMLQLSPSDQFSYL
jgi:hypothetical protein